MNKSEIMLLCASPRRKGTSAMLLERIAPEALPYRHSEGNSTAHIKSVLLGSDHFIFVQERRLSMGQWQGVFLAEFDGPRRRTVWIRVVGDAASG